ncbi:MAG: cysteine hydrolase [Firmicutes bacterium]|nr:cysteine hydrolase [Bacillota bacterium]
MSVSSKVIFWDVDTQVDFMLAGGKLYVPGAEQIIPNLKRLVAAAERGQVFLVSSTDAHTMEDAEFQQWPPHCLRGTAGQLKIPETTVPGFYVITNCPQAPVPEDITPKYRQVVLEKQALDVFTNPNTERLLAVLGRQREYVVFGVVTEYCVWHTAKGLLERGCRVALVEDAIRTLHNADGQRALEELRARGARLITTEAALGMLA